MQARIANVQQIHSMQACLAAQAQPKVARLEARITTNTEEIQQAMVLRYNVFSKSVGTDLGAGSSGAEAKVDRDYFDAYCHHLIVKDMASDRVVGYSRIITSDMLSDVGHFYSASEFDLSQVLQSGKRYMEIGRTCVDDDYRSGPVIGLLWSRIGQFMAEKKLDALMGCASISLADGGAKALAVIDYLRKSHFTLPHQRAIPKLPLGQLQINLDGKSLIPPLLKAYLRMGAKVCGEAFLDRDFNVADVLILLPKEDINQRYMSRFIKQ